MAGKRVKQRENERLNRNRGHGLGRHVAPTPKMLKSAADRAHLYQHSEARARAALNKALGKE